MANFRLTTERIESGISEQGPRCLMNFRGTTVMFALQLPSRASQQSDCGSFVMEANIYQTVMAVNVCQTATEVSICQTVMSVSVYFRWLRIGLCMCVFMSVFVCVCMGVEVFVSVVWVWVWMEYVCVGCGCVCGWVWMKYHKIEPQFQRSTIDVRA